MTDTPRCPCSGAYTTFSFQDEVELRRCVSCGSSAWLVGDDEVRDQAQLHARLRSSFAEQRTQVPRQRARPRRRTLDEMITIVDLRSAAARTEASSEPPVQDLPSTAPVVLPDTMLALLAAKSRGGISPL
jgi:hypothetical protein